MNSIRKKILLKAMLIASIGAQDQAFAATAKKASKPVPQIVAKPVVKVPEPEEKPSTVPQTPVTAEKHGDAAAKTTVVTKNENTSSWKTFVNLRRRYRMGELSDSAMWGELASINDAIDSLPTHQQASVLQTQANILFRTGYPILSAIYASQSIRRAKNPIDDEFSRSWQILREVSRAQPIQSLMEIMADGITVEDGRAPAFGSDWNYFVGNALAKEKKYAKAIDALSAVKTSDRYFFPSKYQQAMIHLDAGQTQEAVTNLRVIVGPASQDISRISQTERRDIADQANMALGRIYYEQRKFADAIKQYRLVSRTGSQFYDSLFEQGWALFMAGYPNHALGSIHSVRSPFFKDTFNPEATMLASIIYYWMCRYDDSRTELALFMENHQDGIQALGQFIDHRAASDEAGYQLFEDTVTGVSSESLGIPREILVMAAQQDSMMHVRDQYAAVLAELQRLDAKGIFSNRKNISTPRGYLEKWSAALRSDLGHHFVTELKAMKSDYDRLYEQAQFLYVELLMSQKDQLLGKELHADSKIDKVTQKENIRGWGNSTQAWATDTKQEYWKDELGFYVYRLQPQCVGH